MIIKLSDPSGIPISSIGPAKTTVLMLRLIRALQPVSRVELAERLRVSRGTITEICTQLIDKKILFEFPIPSHSQKREQGRPRMGLSFSNKNEAFIGVSIGVKNTQIGISTISGKILTEVEVATHKDPAKTLDLINKTIQELYQKNSGHQIAIINVSVPGVTDSSRRKLLYAPHLDWREICIADEIHFEDNLKNSKIPIIVENDAAAAAMYEARVRLSKTSGGGLDDFIVIRSGTGIGVGLIIDGEVYRGTGTAQGHAGEFGHMTIVADGKPCVCGNFGCWEQYAAAPSAAKIYLDGLKNNDDQAEFRFLDIVRKAQNHEAKAIEALQTTGKYLGIGIANVIIGVGIPRVVVGGRLVYGWEFIKKSLFEAIERSMAGKIRNWGVEPGEPKGAGLGGALEVAFNGYINRI